LNTHDEQSSLRVVLGNETGETALTSLATGPCSGSLRLRGFLLFCLLATLPAWSASYYTQKLDDPKAVYVAPTGSNDTVSLQKAINHVQETTGQGIVLVSPGEYRVSDTIYIWPGIRVIGYGAERPVIVLATNTPGYEDASNEKVIIFFAGGRPGFGRNRGRTLQPERRVPDAGPGTFYSAIANVDVQIEGGNSGAVAVRSRYAQHCFLSHIDFHLGSALAGIHEGGNVVEDVRFIGGNYGIWTSRPSPGWPFTVIDCSFEDQRKAAIFEREAGLTLIRPQFRRVPTAVEIEPDRTDQLWIKDARMEEVSGPAIIFGMDKSPRTQINLEGITCRNVPVFAVSRDSGKQFTSPSDVYEVKTFSLGLHFADIGDTPEFKTLFDAVPLKTMPPAVPSDLVPLPPGNTWVNVRELGAKGDGQSDDTEVLQKAIANHSTIYMPSGFYIVRDTLSLRPDTVLIGLHPGATQIILPDGTPAFQEDEGPKALLEAPKGGSNVVIGIGLYTSGDNERAVAALWKAGANSMMNDVRFLGGHGTPLPNGSRENPYNRDHTADPNPNRKWDSQYPSLWVTDGGGGTFLDIWTPSTFAKAGMLVSDTVTEGRVYQMSSEHHVHNEVQVRNAANWKFYALQTEAERGESGSCLPVEVDSSRDIVFANFHAYRVISSFEPFRWAFKISNSRDIRFRNVHCDSNSKVSFDSAVYDDSDKLKIRAREFAWLDISGKPQQAGPAAASVLLAGGAKIEKLADGFHNISGGAVDSHGDFYFVDARPQQIYQWNVSSHKLTTISNVPPQPVNLAADRSGNLIVISYAGNGEVYTLSSNDDVAQLKPEAVTNRSGKDFYLPVSDWRLNRDSLSNPAAQFVSPDGTTVVPTGQDFLRGATSWGVKSSPSIRSFGLGLAVPGKPFYITDECELRTWVADVNEDGSLENFRLFAEQGGEGVTVDSKGNVYIAAGQIYVYDPKGKLIDTIEVPERPIQLMFGGEDRKTLFVAARTSLYSVRMQNSGG
jgi:SMP-30/Gluconolactonase/LRE-like region/Pectate lyase superfamily protein